MTTDETDARLTAYALNDASLTDADRTEIEAAIATDPDVRREVEEVRELAGVLTNGFAVELTVATPSVTVPAKKPDVARWKLPRWVGYVPVAAAVLLTVTAMTAMIGGNASSTFSLVGSATIPRSWAAGPMPTAKQAAAAPRPPWVSEPSESTPADGGVNPTPPVPPSLPQQIHGGFGGGGIQGGIHGGFGGGGIQGGIHSGFSGSVGFQGGGGYMGGFGGGIGGGFQGTRPTPTERPGLVTGTHPTDPAVTLPKLETVHQPTPEPKPDSPDGRYSYGYYPPQLNDALRPGNDRFPAMVENAFTPVEGQNALSTFGVDVDTASYAIVRKYLTHGQPPPPTAVRLEEIVNYFPYQDKPPTGDDPFAVTVEVADCPWQPGHRLARIGLKAKPVATGKRPPSNLVFLIDVSGSMNEPNKLPLVKAALKLLVGQLGENDRVAMVVYAGNAGLVLDSTNAVNKTRILEALDRLEAGGSTNGAGGLQQAYDVAVANFVKGGTNRVILCTDGDWNVGTTGTEALVKMIEDKRTTGVFLSVFGFGMGNLRDEMMVKLAGKGNGNYGYVDTIREAHKALVEQLSGTLVTVAKDVKIQVEFNPAAVKSYRLLGYEKRALAAKDFADDTKDAGEMGAGHVVTALYELVPAGEAGPVGGDGLKYQPATPAVLNPAAREPAKEAFTVKMRHKKPDGDVSVLRELPVANTSVGYRDASEDFRFAAAAASFALVLRDSAHKGYATLATARELAESATRFDPNGYRAEFVELVRRAEAVSGKR